MLIFKDWQSAGGVVVSLLVCFLSACAPVQERTEDLPVDPYVYPAPPDEPRFAFERMIVNSSNVERITETKELQIALTGATLTGEGMQKPYAVAVHKGRIFVSDTAERVIKVFDVPEEKFFVIRDAGLVPMTKPFGIDVDQRGNLYVADGGARLIRVFDRDGKFLRDIGDEKQFDRLSSVAVNPEGTRVYAVDVGGVSSKNHRVRVYDGASGELLRDIGTRGNGNGEFNLPRDLAVGRNGDLYVVDSGNFRVQVFDRDGEYLRSFGKVGKQMGDFARPKEIATDNDGNLYVIDTAFGNFQIFNADGDLLMFIGTRNEVNAPGHFMLPSGVFVDEDGRVYVVDQWFKKIDVFRPYSLPVGGGNFSAQTPNTVKLENTGRSEENKNEAK